MHRYLLRREPRRRYDDDDVTPRVNATNVCTALALCQRMQIAPYACIVMRSHSFYWYWTYRIDIPGVFGTNARKF